MKYIIYDWAGNHKFQGEVFDSVDDAFSRIVDWLEEQGMSDDEVEETLQEYYVEPIKEN